MYVEGSAVAQTRRSAISEPQMKNGRRSVRFLSNLVAWDGIEPPTQGFSKRAADSKAAPRKALRVVGKRKAA